MPKLMQDMGMTAVRPRLPPTCSINLWESDVPFFYLASTNRSTSKSAATETSLTQGCGFCSLARRTTASPPPPKYDAMVRLTLLIETLDVITFLNHGTPVSIILARMLLRRSPSGLRGSLAFHSRPPCTADPPRRRARACAHHPPRPSS